MIKNTLATLLILFCYNLFGQTFNSIWDTEQLDGSASNQVVIPTNPSYTYNYTVDWGDGLSDTNVTGDITHTYASPGRYTIEISGNFPSIYFNNAGDRNKIIEILAWGSLQWQTMENAFYGCENLNFDAIDSPDLSQATTLKNMFRDADVFNGVVNNWDISTITDISGIFSGAVIFNRPLDNWDTGNVTDMSETFRRANLYNEPLDNWNTALVTNMSDMFNSANNFNQNISGWDVSQVTNMSNMFSYASDFNQPLNIWNVARVEDMSGMFIGTTFNFPLSTWDVSSVTNMSAMFQRTRNFNQPLDNWDVSNVTDMSSMFDGFYWTNVFNQPLTSWDVSNVTNMRFMFRNNRDFNQPLNSWNVSNVTDMEGMFEDAASFNQDISVWAVSNVTNMRSMFEYARAFNQPLNNWTVTNVTNMSSMFERTEVFNQSLDNWDVSGVTNMSSMFSRALVFNQSLNNWDTSAVTNMSNMFNSYNVTTVFNQPLNNWNTGAVINMSGMFRNASSFDQNLSGWNVTNVSNMNNMLSNSGLSQTNYDNALIGWAAQSVRSNVNLGATNLNYCDGREERQDLIDNHSWTVSGDIINCSFAVCTSLVSPKNGDTNVPSNANLIWALSPGATGYRISVRRVNGGTTQIIYDNEDVGNVVGVDFTTDLTPGDEVFITIVPYNASGPATGCTEESFTVVPSWVGSPDAFVLTFDTSITENYTSAANQVEIEVNRDFTYDYSIDWGDDQFDNNVSSAITHTYLTPGVYTVTIIGNYPAHYYDYFSDNIKLLQIDQWGTQQWQSMENAFYNCRNMTYHATDVPDLLQVANMSSTFYQAYLFNGNIDSWNVSNATDMSLMFAGAREFNQPLNSWNVGNVTDMRLMFLSAPNFNQPLNNWNTSSVTNMARMFEGARAFNQPLNSWNVSNVTDMLGMFKIADMFNQPLNNWDVSNVTNMSEMFNGFIYNMSFNQNINSWNVNNVTDMSSMFRYCGDFNQPLNNWNVGHVTDMSNMFYNAGSFNQPLDNWDVSSVTMMVAMFQNASTFNQNIDAWNVTNVLNMRSMFQRAIAFNQPLNSWDVNSVVNMSSMFERAEAFNQPLGAWNVSAVANMASMFESALLFNQPINAWDVSSVTLMNSMFESTGVFNQNINNWDVSSVTTMESMFESAIAFNEPLGNWDTGEVLTTKQMFSEASVFNQNIDSWNVSFVRDMEAMFKSATAYNQPLNSWNVASVTTMRDMFSGASAFNQLIDNWNVRSVTTMEYMFNGATAFNQALNNWRVSGVENMNYMFRNATVFNQPLDQWNIGTVSMRSMFENANSLDQEFSDWNVSGVTDMASMLNNTALSRENYDTTLIAWSEQSLNSGIALGAQGLLYCDAEDERQLMIDTYGWSITGDVLDCPIPVCTQLVAPLNGDTNVPVNTNLSWESVLYAKGYRLTVRVNPGNITIVNDEIVNDTSYEFATDFSGGETVFVTIIPFNDVGDAGTCVEESFEITSSATPTVPDCTNLTMPTNGASNIGVDTDLEWTAVANADGYRITAETVTGGNDIIDNIDVGNVTSYDRPSDLPEDTTIYVTITPYNSTGPATSCTEESFTTEIIPVPPTCTSLTNPLNGATNVPIDTDLSWDAVANADGYLLTVGTTGGGIEIHNSINVGNVTTYDLPDDLDTNRLIFVTIIPFNAEGDATGCAEESFRTGNSTAVVPGCTNLTSPTDTATNVLVTAGLSWDAVAGATGYRLNVGTLSGDVDILDGEDVTGTTYSFTTDLPEATEIFVTIIPYNAVGSAMGCTEESFTTETLPTVPDCTNLTSPTDSSTNVLVTAGLSWDAVTGATGYRLNVGTLTGDVDILDGEDVTGTTYSFTTDLPEGTEIFVTIIPYNAVGSAMGCAEESFTTETLPTVPDCTNLTSPTDASTNVLVTAGLSWDAVTGATGYRLNVGTLSGDVDILDGEDVTGTTYSFTTDLPEGTEIFVTIIPYNAVGNAMGCAEESFTTETLPTVPDCTNLTSPTDASTNVLVTTGLSWDAVIGATDYRLNVGTLSGDVDILDGEDVTGTTYSFTTDLPEGTEIFVTIIPYNAVGSAMGCSEESFTTETLPTAPGCTSLTSPTDASTNVLVTAGLSWDAVTGATGYRLNVGTLTGDVDILDGEDVTGTTYSFTTDLPGGTEIFVTIIPYNAVGSAMGCSEESFTTETLPTVPDCTSLTAPLDGDADVAIDVELNWNTVANADGYEISLGTRSGATDILNGEDVGNTTSFSLTSDLPDNTIIYVTITPYNVLGEAVSCTEESFTTKIVLIESKYGFSPNGDGINDFWEIKGIENSPQNTVNIYNRWGDLVFSIPNYDNRTNVFRGEANNLTKLGASALPNGTYFFDIKVSGAHNLKKLKGFLVIKR